MTAETQALGLVARFLASPKFAKFRKLGVPAVWIVAGALALRLLQTGFGFAVSYQETQFKVNALWSVFGQATIQALARQQAALQQQPTQTQQPGDKTSQPGRQAPQEQVFPDFDD